MSESVRIPVFPLPLLPLPGELIPLHIFEPRYKELLHDAEEKDISFGIFLNHECNVRRVGAVVKLESVIKRYAGGASDIVVRCTDMFSARKIYEAYKTKAYPGGEITSWNIALQAMPGARLYELFLAFQEQRKINHHFVAFTLYQIAAELNLDFLDRYKLMTTRDDRREKFLMSRLQFQLRLLQQAEKSKDVFHLN